MTRRLTISLAMLTVGLGLLVASGLARPAGSASAAGEARKGGTLRVSYAAEVDFVDPALAYSGRSWLLEYATCAKLFNYPDAPGAAGTRLVPEVVDRYAVSEGRADVHLHVEADVPLPHRRQGDRAELRRRVQSGCATQARVAGDRLHARDRRRHVGDRRQGAIDLRRPRARPLPAPDQADQAGRGLHRPTLDAVLLPDPAEHADHRDQRPRPARAPTTSKSESSTSGSC